MEKATLKQCGVLAAGALLVAGLMAVGGGVASADPTSTCVSAGTSGFSAAVVASQGQTISNRTVDATGCDVGIYVAAPHVTINHVTVTGANDAGILVEATSDVTIMQSDVHGNGLNSAQEPPLGSMPGPDQLAQAFGVSLFGVSDSIITRNQIHDNGRGGIGIMDNGPYDPGHLGGTGMSTTPIPSDNVVVSRNTLWGNLAGCGIVVSAFNTGNHVSNVMITRNTVKGTMAPGDVGGIVAQSNGLNSTVSDITISRNTVTDSGEGGVIVHAAAPGSQTADVTVTRNVLSGNNWMTGETGHTTGVVVSTLGPAQNTDTVVSRNEISNQFYGVWTSGPNPPTLSRNDITVTSGGSAFFSG